MFSSGELQLVIVVVLQQTVPFRRLFHGRCAFFLNSTTFASIHPMTAELEVTYPSVQNAPISDAAMSKESTLPSIVTIGERPVASASKPQLCMPLALGWEGRKTSLAPPAKETPLSSLSRTASCPFLVHPGGCASREVSTEHLE